MIADDVAYNYAFNKYYSDRDLNPDFDQHRESTFSILMLIFQV